MKGCRIRTFYSLVVHSSPCPLRSGFIVGSGHCLLSDAWSPKTASETKSCWRRKPPILPFLLLTSPLLLDFLPGNQPRGAETGKRGTFRSPATAVPGAQLGLGRERRKCSKQNRPREGRARGGRGPGMSGATWRIPAKR